MKHLLMMAAVAGCCASLSARIVENPEFECRKSSVLTVKTIDLGKDSTRVTFDVVFRPGWWIQVDSASYLSDPVTGTRYLPTSTEGIAFGEQHVTPAEGCYTIAINYPPLPEGLSAVDFSTGSTWATYGIDLTGKRHTADVAGAFTVTDTDYKPCGDFFTSGVSRLSGAIKGYDPRLGFDLLELYVSDLPLGISAPMAVKITSDGTFSREIPLTTPQMVTVMVNNTYMQVYLEPGNDLQLLLDWEGVLAMDRSRGLIDLIPGVKYGGSLGQINRQLADAPQTPMLPVRYSDKVTPRQACDSINADMDRHDAAIAAYVAAHPELLPGVADGLAANSLAERTYALLDVEIRSRDDVYVLDRSNPPFDYEMLRRPYTRLAAVSRTSLNFIRPMHILLNRMGFCHMHYYYIDSEQPDGPEYSAKRGRLMTEFMGHDTPPLIWQLAISSRIGQTLHEAASSPEHYRTELDDHFDSEILEPALKSRLNDCYEGYVKNAGPQPLPDTEGGRIMQEIMKPYLGKWVLVDFWGTSCGPCRAGIQNSVELRNKYRDTMAFLFVTSERDSPERAYNSYVAQHLAGENSIRISDEKMSLIRELFKFTGIPRYVMFDPEGRVVDSDFSGYHNLEYFIQHEML